MYQLTRATTTHRLTNFNVAISVVSLFILLVKMIMIIMKFYYPVLGLIVSLGLTVLYTVSVYGQAGPDYADPEHPSPVAWYIAKSCSVARPFNAEGNCQIAKGAFGATIYLLYVFFPHHHHHPFFPSSPG